MGNSGTAGLMVTKISNSGIIRLMVAEVSNSGTIGLMVVEMSNSSTTGLMLVEIDNLGTIGLMVTEMSNSSIIGLTLAEIGNLGTIGLMVAEMSNSSTIGLMEYVLHAPLLEQRPYHSESTELSISVDALEVGLHFPVHPTIVDLLREWRISPSQVVPNSWRDLIAFLGECRGVGIIPTRTLFFACFRLCISRGGYYLTAWAGFKVNEVSTNNKGWKARYLFVNNLNWGFRVDWSKRPGETLVSGEAVMGRPSKRVKIVVRKHKSRRGKGGSHVTTWGKELVASTEEDSSSTHCQPRSMKDLCSTRVCKGDEGYYVLQIVDSMPKDSNSTMRARWPNMTYSAKVCDDS
ncbi:hypothetical protein BHE74_00005261 [Ensete ventricosum]|nr:hypothetical protein BHE74_00005261 [Ensete ventricosum]